MNHAAEPAWLLRKIGPAEQMAHSFLEDLPLVGLALLAVIGAGKPLDWSLKLRDPALLHAMAVHRQERSGWPGATG